MTVILESDCRVPNQFSRVFSKLCRNCKGVLFRHIRDRRERLKKFALERLPRAEASALGLYQPAVLDTKANLVNQALAKRGFEMPSPLRLDVCLTHRAGRFDALNVDFDLYQPVSMFHQSPINSPFESNFEALYQLGFRGFEEPASLEFSPLLSWLTCTKHVHHTELEFWEINRINACIWLIDHGANLWDPISRDIPATTAHYICDSIDAERHRLLASDPEKLKIQLLMEILSIHDVRDNCHCRCSLGGCSPLVWFLRRFNGPWRPFSYRSDAGIAYEVQQFPRFFSTWKPSLSVAQHRSAIRYLTFELLGIRHTCSHDYEKAEKPTADETEELLSEDASLLQLLEELVEKFNSELQSVITEDDPLGLLVWKTHWAGSMEKVLKNLAEYRLDENEGRSAQQIGVKWNNSDDSPENQVAPEREYQEPVWSVEFDDEEMWRDFEDMEEWTSRLDLIMSTAIPNWRGVFATSLS